MTLVSPVTYQGGKGRLASQIVEIMKVPRDAMFYDICCGSGTVSLALIETGHLPEKIGMVDQGPWGLFWQKIGEGSFDLDVFRSYCAALPKDPRGIKTHIEDLYRRPVGADCVYVFLLLQASAIGGTAVRIEGDRWRSSGFRDYWLPTETSSRRSPVNPMMPMPDTILARVTEIAKRARGICGQCCDASYFVPLHGYGYIDPPYQGTTGYHYKVDAAAVAKRFPGPCFVSEGRALSDQAICLSEGRAKGGITGQRKRAANEEWLSCFNGNRGPLA